MDGLTEGRIVHYVLPDGVSKGEHRPAIIVKVWNQETGCCNLSVFQDWSNDKAAPTGDGASGVFWATSRLYSETAEPGTWHWIEKA